MAGIESSSKSLADFPGRVSPIPTFELFHEIGDVPTDYSIERSVNIDDLAQAKTVIFRSHVVSSSARALRSPEYLATNRRRQSRRIADMVVGLKQHTSDENFVVWTHEPLEQLRKLIQNLSDAEQHSSPEHEGNSCEILRQVRDTFLDIGWERYRDGNVRDTVAGLLSRLATANEVTAEDADASMDSLLDVGLNPSVGLSFADVEKEDEVSH